MSIQPRGLFNIIAVMCVATMATSCLTGDMTGGVHSVKNYEASDEIQVAETPLATLADCDNQGGFSAIAEQQVNQVLDDADAQRAALFDPDALTIVTCGTGSPIPSERAQACTAIFADNMFLIFDAGDGAQRSMESDSLPISDVTAVFLTHLHSDHVADIGEVISRSWILGRTHELPVYGPSGVERIVDGFNMVYEADNVYRRAHHGADIFDVELQPADARVILEADETGMVVFNRNGLKVTAFAVSHEPIEPALGYRIEYGGRVVVISGDTKETPSLAMMSEDADVLVSEVMNFEAVENIECALKEAGDPRNSKIMSDIRTYHIDVNQLGELAETAGVEQLVLTHQVPSVTDELQVFTLFEQPFDDPFAGELIVAEDGQQIVLPVLR